MKFVLAYTICSAITGFCNNTTVSPIEFNSWSDCVKAGSLSTVQIVNQYEEKFNEEKLYVTYFCNEVKKENV
jgi:hypothetical protein